MAAYPPGILQEEYRFLDDGVNFMPNSDHLTHKEFFEMLGNSNLDDEQTYALSNLLRATEEGSARLRRSTERFTIHPEGEVKEALLRAEEIARNLNISKELIEKVKQIGEDNSPDYRVE